MWYEEQRKRREWKQKFCLIFRMYVEFRRKHLWKAYEDIVAFQWVEHQTEFLSRTASVQTGSC